MDVPERPPSVKPQGLRIDELLSREDIRAFATRTHDAYVPWNKFRHKPIPSDVSVEAAWFIAKSSRLQSRRNLPLIDVHGHPCGYSVPRPVHETLHRIDRMSGNSIAIASGEQSSFGPIRDQLLVSSLMEEAIATSQIEGAATTRAVAKEMLRSNRDPRDRGERMIVNSYQTMRLLKTRLDEPLTLDLLLDLQKSMTEGTLEDDGASGRLRIASDDVVITSVDDGKILFTPPPASELKARLKQFLAFANDDAKGADFVHPLIKAAILHFWLAYLHPFVDGNGRTARALFHWFMLKNGYWLFEFLTVSRIIFSSRIRYYRAFLETEYDEGDLTYFILYNVDATDKALRKLHEHIAEKLEEQRTIASSLSRFPDLNHRQRALLSHALRRAETVYTFQSHARSHDVTLLTSRSDLLILLRFGLLTEGRQGRERAFFAAPDLKTRLRPSR